MLSTSGTNLGNLVKRNVVNWDCNVNVREHFAGGTSYC